MKSWKTTLVGLGGAIGYGLVTYFQNHGVESKDIALMIVQIVLGYFAKDFDKTGGK